MATKTLNIALDERLIAAIDKTVKKDMGSRSEYFRRLALNDLERRRRWDKILEEGSSLGKKMDITSEEHVYRILDEYKLEKQQR